MNEKFFEVCFGRENLHQGKDKYKIQYYRRLLQKELREKTLKKMMTLDSNVEKRRFTVYYSRFLYFLHLPDSDIPLDEIIKLRTSVYDKGIKMVGDILNDAEYTSSNKELLVIQKQYTKNVWNMRTDVPMVGVFGYFWQRYNSTENTEEAKKYLGVLIEITVERHSAESVNYKKASDENKEKIIKLLRTHEKNWWFFRDVMIHYGEHTVTKLRQHNIHEVYNKKFRFFKTIKKITNKIFKRKNYGDEEFFILK